MVTKKSSNPSKKSKMKNDISKEEMSPATVDDTVVDSSPPKSPATVDDTVVDSSPPKSPATVDGEKSDKLNETSKFVNLLNTYTDRVNHIYKQLKDISAMGKTLEKEYNQVIKQISKQKKTKKMDNRPLSGFAMPSLLTDELYDFLSIEKGQMVPRKDVTRMINEYITKNELRDSNDKRKIKPDKELKRIFNCKDDDSVTYFNLQAYMKHHFIKKTVAI